MVKPLTAREKLALLREALDDIPDEEAAAEAVRELGIDIPKWAEEIRARVKTVADGARRAVAEAHRDAPSAGPVERKWENGRPLCGRCGGPLDCFNCVACGGKGCDECENGFVLECNNPKQLAPPKVERKWENVPGLGLVERAQPRQTSSSVYDDPDDDGFDYLEKGS